MKPPKSDEMLRLALEHPPGSDMRRSYIKAALMLEPRPRGRPKGTAKPQIDNFAWIILWHVAFRTGERGAERLGRLAKILACSPKKAAPASIATVSLSFGGKCLTQGFARNWTSWWPREAMWKIPKRWFASLAMTPSGGNGAPGAMAGDLNNPI